MNPIVLVAELLTHGIDIGYHDGILYFVGEFNALPLGLQLELADNQRELTDWASGNPMEATHVG